MTPAVLTIAGSDSSGGAGIQADLRALDHLGIAACTAVTAITAQGPDGVTAVQFADPDVLGAQIDEAFRTYHIAAVKIGMLGSEKQISAVASALKRNGTSKVVLDPVLRSTSGTELLTKTGVAELISKLLPAATIVTPNLDELAALTGMPTGTPSQDSAAARSLLAKGAGSVLVKGGHRPVQPFDILVLPDAEPIVFHGERISTNHARGTGCVLSALIAGQLADGRNLLDAIRWAKQDLAAALSRPMVPISGAGYPRLREDLSHEQQLSRVSGIYFVTDRSLNPEVTHTIGARHAVSGGAAIIQLREKGYDTRYVTELGHRLRRIVPKQKALFIVNDRVDVALACDADGVHLGPGDMSPVDARRILGARKMVGVSVSTVEEAKILAPYASYLAVGAIFGSSTKSDAGPPVGTERITEIKAAFPDKKIVAIGGINLSNIASVAAAGADAAAVVSAVICAPNPEHATRELLSEFERGKLLAS